MSVDEMTLDEMTLDEMTLDEMTVHVMSVDEMTRCCRFIKNGEKSLLNLPRISTEKLLTAEINSVS
jgi:hypothetical protein